MHAVPIVMALWLGFWEWACVSGVPLGRAITWTLVNAAVGFAIYLRAGTMGVAPTPSCLVLRYLLFSRSFSWAEVERFDLVPLRGGLALRLRTVNGRQVNVPAGQFAATDARESWLRTHRLVWSGGESSDVLGVLNGLVASHRADRLAISGQPASDYATAPRPASGDGGAARPASDYAAAAGDVARSR
jgi:hypothetical protein